MGCLSCPLFSPEARPYQRSVQLLENITGHCLSVATLVNISQNCSTGLSGFIEEVKDHLHQAPLINSDETGYYVEGKSQWSRLRRDYRTMHLVLCS